MNRYARLVLVGSRILLSVVSLLNGFGVIDQTMAAKELIGRGVPAAIVPFAMMCARTVEVVGGFGLALGVFPQWSALALVAFWYLQRWLVMLFGWPQALLNFSRSCFNFPKTLRCVEDSYSSRHLPSSPHCFRNAGRSEEAGIFVLICVTPSRAGGNGFPTMRKSLPLLNALPIPNLRGLKRTNCGLICLSTAS
ncbi:MAG TPA: DoxX family protein [Terriglobales bacterium]